MERPIGEPDQKSRLNAQAARGEETPVEVLRQRSSSVQLTSVAAWRLHGPSAAGRMASDRPQLSAEKVIEHHQWVWANLLAKHAVSVVRASDV